MKPSDNTIVTTFSQCRIAGYLHLNDEAQKLYKKKCGELIAQGYLKTTYLQSLLMWADCYATYWRLKKEVEEEGYTFATHNKFGDEVISANPKVKMMNDALKQANGIASDFGLTPRAGKHLKGEETKIVKTALEQFNEYD